MGGVAGVRIGVLGGIGPEATAAFYARLIKRLQERSFITTNEDYPQIIINSIPAPELTHFSVKASALAPYEQGILELASQNVDFIVMVCNTIHLYHEQLQKLTVVPILDVREVVKAELFQRGVQRAAIIGTPLTVKSGLYRHSSYTLIEPSNTELQQLASAIRAFNRGHEKEKQRVFVRALCKQYLASGAELIIAGCTEFALMLASTEIPLLDTIDVLVEATIITTLQVRRNHDESL